MKNNNDNDNRRRNRRSRSRSSNNNRSSSNKDKKRSKEWIREERELMDEALILMMRSKILREDADRIGEEIERLVGEYPDEYISQLPWEKKEEMFKRSEEIEKRLTKAAALWV